MAFQCINYLERTGDGAEKVFKKVVELRCTHSGVSSWNEMCRKKSISCSSSGSLALQEAGCLDVGKKMGHIYVKGQGIKPSSINTISKAMFGEENIRNARLIWVNCYERDLPFWLKRRGVIYIQWSNCCTSAGMINGKHWIWSTNEEGGYHRQKDGSMRYDQYKETANRSGVLSCGGHYPWGGIIHVCVLPFEKWDQHFAVEVLLEKHGKKETRQEHFGNHYETIQKMVDRMCRDHEYFCRWAADYVLERYAKVSDFKKSGHFDYTKEVQEAVNKISKGAREVWAGKHGDLKQRQIDFGEWYEQVQRQVNRTTK